MMTYYRKALYVPQFANIVISVQTAFHLKFNCDSPCGKNILRLYRQFETTACVRKRKNTAQPKMSAQYVDRVRAFLPA